MTVRSNISPNNAELFAIGRPWWRGKYQEMLPPYHSGRNLHVWNTCDLHVARLSLLSTSSIPFRAPSGLLPSLHRLGTLKMLVFLQTKKTSHQGCPHYHPSPPTDLTPWFPLLLSPMLNLRGWSQPSCIIPASPLQLHKPSPLFSSSGIVFSIHFLFSL